MDVLRASSDRSRTNWMSRRRSLLPAAALLALCLVAPAVAAPDPRIVNGTEASPGEYPSTGYLSVDKPGPFVDQCGGTIHAVYATMGDTDLLVIVDFPGVAEAVKASITLTKALGITFSSVPALGVEEFDKLTAGKR